MSTFVQTNIVARTSKKTERKKAFEEQRETMSTGHDRPTHEHSHGMAAAAAAGSGGGAAAGDSSASLLSAEEYEALVRHEVQCVQRGDMAACRSWQRLLQSVCQREDGGEEDSPARAWACFDLGQLHSFGQKSFFDAALAARYYQRACTQKHYRACYNLAMMYVPCTAAPHACGCTLPLYSRHPSEFQAWLHVLAGTVKVQEVCQEISKKPSIF